ncbi:MAG: XdhC family protein [Pseudomonadota bacterium]
MPKDTARPDRSLETRYLEHARDLVGFVIDERAAGRPAALLVVTDTVGGALRAVGSLVAVTDDGLMAGYVSNGCVDADVVLQAQMALEAGVPRSIRYGQGSPFVDIALPCGGAIELLVLPNPDERVLAEALAELDARRPVTLSVNRSSGDLAVCNAAPDAVPNDVFIFTATPKPRMRLAGRGAVLMSTARLGMASGFEVIVASPDLEEVGALAAEGAVAAHHLTSLDTPPGVADDPWTAFLLLFHDHEWEAAMLAQALDGPAFFIGAMGSKRTHQARLLGLEVEGRTPDEIARVIGPLGLIRSLRDAQLIAVSAIAQVVDALPGPAT